MNFIMKQSLWLFGGRVMFRYSVSSKLCEGNMTRNAFYWIQDRPVSCGIFPPFLIAGQTGNVVHASHGSALNFHYFSVYFLFPGEEVKKKLDVRIRDENRDLNYVTRCRYTHFTSSMNQPENGWYRYIQFSTVRDAQRGKLSISQWKLPFQP